MSSNQRRFFLKSSAAGIASIALPTYSILSSAAETKATDEKGKDATRLLAQYALNTKYEDLPPNIKREAARAFVNFVGVTVGSCRHEAVNISIDSLRPVSGSNQATILGAKCSLH